MDAEEISRRLRTGRVVLDADFDAWLPDAVRPASGRFWTEVNVIVRVTRWLSACGAHSVLDVGSGAGKFCVVGALSSRLVFTGVEQRPHLIDAARALTARFAVGDRVRFVHGDLTTVDFAHFDALYFYNPFGENIFPIEDRLDDSIEISRACFERDIARTQARLALMPVGTHLVTYNGYGGRVPDSFELLAAEEAGLSTLRLWHKARAHDDGGYWLELEGETFLRESGQLELIPIDEVRARGPQERDAP